MPNAATPASMPSPIIGTSPIAELLRTHDWSATPLGPIASWPDALVIHLNLILAAKFPMAIFWGKDLLQFYNDAHAPAYAEKHPSALGQPGRAFWQESWSIVGPQIEAAFLGETTFRSNQLVPIFRDGHLQDSWWVYNYSPIRDLSSAIVGVLVVAHETTSEVLAQRHADEFMVALRREREQFRDLFLQAPVPIIMMHGPEHRITFINPSYVRLIRRNSPADVLGLPIHQAIPEFDGQGYFELLDRVYRTGLPFIGKESLAVVPNEHTGALEDRFFNFIYQAVRDSAGDIEGVIAIAIEITDQVHARTELERRGALLFELQQETERQRIELETIYNTAPIALSLFDAKTFNYLRCNERTAEILGRPVAEIIGNPAMSMVNIPLVKEIFTRAAAGIPTRNILMDGEIPTRPGVHRYWIGNYSPVYAADGTVYAITGAAVEVTQQKKTEAALIQTEKLAVVGRLAASIAHEINNPLESVTNLLYLARNSTSFDEIQSFLVTAEQELQRVSLITNQTLRFHKQSTKPIAVTCEQLFEATLAIHQAKLNNAGITVHKRKRARRSVLCLDGEIRQVLNNLLGNAIDATPAGGRILIRSRESTDWRTNRKGLTLTVADTGSGIPASTLAQIFEPFFTTKGNAGTGLGLWISKEIVDRHNGRLTVRSSTNPAHPGTVFALFLPFESLA